MAARIARHRAERGAGWQTLEEPLELAAALRAEAREGRVILVDCVTLWLSNVLLANRDPAAEIADLIETIATLKGPAVFVSNEVGAGVVPGDAARPDVPRLAGPGESGTGARLRRRGRWSPPACRSCSNRRRGQIYGCAKSAKTCEISSDSTHHLR